MRILNGWSCKLLVFFLWLGAFSSAYAGTLGAGLLTISFWSVLVASVLAVTGGIAATLSRAERDKNRVTWRELGADVVVSVVRGMVVFFLAEWLAWPVPLEAAAITLGGFGGAEVLRRLLGRGLQVIEK